MRVVFIALFLAACGKSSTGDDTPTAGEFIPLQSDFAGFTSWTHYDVGDEAVDSVHVAGPREVFINKLPPKGSTHFPVGTMIVKETQVGADKTQWEVHAAVKRGGNYNANGAIDWEWFDLSLDADAVPTINWSGAQPPPGGGYGAPVAGDPSATDCNTCHAVAKANDYIQDSFLQLKNLQ